MKKSIRESAALRISLMGWVFAFCNFIPIFVMRSQSTQETASLPSDFIMTSNSTSSSGDDYYYIVGFDEQPGFREAAISALMISIPLAVDTLLDMLPSWFNTFLFAESRQLPVKKSGLEIFHLTPAEKLSYIVGVVCMSTISYAPVRSYETPAILYFTFLNVSTILSTCPILAFLTRCSPTWTPSCCITIAVLVCASALLSSFTNLCDSESATYVTFALAVNVIVTFAFGLFIVMCGVSAVRTVWFQVPYHDSLPVNQSAPNTTGDSNSAQDMKRRSTDRFRNCVVAAHILSTVIEAVINPVWYFEANQLTSREITIFMYVFTAAAAVVYVTEFRVRKSEVTRALFDLLDAKKSYVRYISHELRTPMNAAFLGLKFVTDNMKENNASADPETAEIYDTLCDVQTACSTAVDILNDLLTFEKLESGILELHKTELYALNLVRDCVGLFSAQAREKSIILECELGVLDTEKLLVDKFKIDQVLRNLISNAIKFTPSGKKVIVMVAVEKPVVMSAANLTVSETTAEPKCGDVEETDAAPPLGNLVIKVVDEGAGISASNQKRLFNEVVQFNPDKLQAGGGSGFGLFICKGIVDLHGGKISVFSEGEGKGSTFTLELPIFHKPPREPDSNHSDKMRKAHGHRRSGLVAVAAERFRRFSRSSQVSIRSRHADAAVCNETSSLNDRACSNYDLDTTNIGFLREKPSQKEATDSLPRLPPALGLGEPSNSSSTHNKLYIDGSGGAGTDTGGNTGADIDGINHKDLIHSDGAITDEGRRTRLAPIVEVSYSHSASCRDQNDIHISVKSVLDSDRIPPKAPLEPSYEILVVDDSSMNRKMLVKILKAAGHVCEEAEDGVKAMEKMKQRMSSREGKREYDAVLMDFVMPNMDGPTATKGIRKEGYKGIIFGVTGNGLKSDIQHFESNGANKVLVKPFILEEFTSYMMEFNAER